MPAQEEVRLNGSAMQCRITTEDPENHFIPDYGRISAYREATGFGIRLDGGTAYSSAVITPFYDSLLEKVTAWAPTHDEAINRMDRALREFRIRGREDEPAVPRGAGLAPAPSGRAPTPPASSTRRRSCSRSARAATAPRGCSQFIGDVMVNGNPEAVGRPEPAHVRRPRDPGGAAARPGAARARATACASSAPRASRAGCATSSACC